MSRFRFVHAADLHLDTPFEGLRELSPEIGQALRDASLQAFDALVDLCVDVGAAFLVVAGDVYDGAERGLRAQLRFRSGLERLSRNGIQVFVVHGNHDPDCGESDGYAAIREWPEGTRIFGSERVEAAPVVRGGERIATVYGISYPRRDVRENLALAFPRRAARSETQAADEGLRLGLLHCNAGGHSGHAPYSACSLEDLAAAAIDYWALGHVHTRQVLGEDPWVVYSGNLQGRTPHAGEQGAKGAMVVEVEDGRVAGVDFHALDRVRFLPVNLDVSDRADLGEVERSLQAAADALRAAHPGRALVLSARLEGRSVVQSDLARPGVLAELLESLRDLRRDDRPFVWWSALSSNVSRPVDREAVRARDDFCAQLFALTDELGERPEELLRFAREAFADLPDELRTVPVPPVSQDELGLLLRQAEQAALQQIADDEPGRSR